MAVAGSPIGLSLILTYAAGDVVVVTPPVVVPPVYVAPPTNDTLWTKVKL